MLAALYGHVIPAANESELVKTGDIFSEQKTYTISNGLEKDAGGVYEGQVANGSPVTLRT